MNRMKILHFLTKTKEKDSHFCKSCGADTRIRTGDLILTNAITILTKMTLCA